MKSKVLIQYSNSRRLMECDEMVTGLIYDKNNKRIEFCTITLYKNGIVLDTIKITIDNYEKLLKLLDTSMQKWYDKTGKVLCLFLSEDNTRISLEHIQK